MHETRSKILHSENIKKAALAERSLFVNQLMTIHKTKAVGFKAFMIHDF